MDLHDIAKIAHRIETAISIQESRSQRYEDRQNDLTESFRMIITGLERMQQSILVICQMTETITRILTEVPDGPNPIAEALRDLVVVCRDNQESIEHMVSQIDRIMAKAVAN